MHTPPARKQVNEAERPRTNALGAGIWLGLKTASVFSGFVLMMALIRGSTTYESYGGVTTWHIVAFYYAVGAAGGALFGFLEPWRARYAGKVVVAYVMLFLVYGGGSIGFLPMLNQSNVPRSLLWGVLGGWALACLLLAPLYVAMFNKSAS